MTFDDVFGVMLLAGLLMMWWGLADEHRKSKQKSAKQEFSPDDFDWSTETVAPEFAVKDWEVTTGLLVLAELAEHGTVHYENTPDAVQALAHRMNARTIRDTPTALRFPNYEIVPEGFPEELFYRG